MTDLQIRKALLAIERDDPVARLAAKLVQEGVTEEQLCKALNAQVRPTIGDPIKNELHNKFRDVTRCGMTYNHYNRKLTWK